MYYFNTHTEITMNPKLLLVEDEFDFSALFLLRAKYHKWDCLHDTTGAEAVQLARIHHPDLIILDLNLPEISGLGILRELKKDESLSKIPVMVFSGNNETLVVKEATHLGANCFYTKGGALADLFAIIEQYLPVPKHNLAFKSLAAE